MPHAHIVYASEAIRLLQEIIDEHGDLPVVNDMDTCPSAIEYNADGDEAVALIAFE